MNTTTVVHIVHGWAGVHWQVDTTGRVSMSDIVGVIQWFRYPNKEIICQLISLCSKMVLVEEKNLTRAYQIRQISFYIHI